MHQFWKRLCCTALLAAMAFGGAVLTSQSEEKAALSLPCPPGLLEQLDYSLSSHLTELIPAQQPISQQMSQQLLYPGGQAIGILLRTDGILVVDHSPVLVDGKPVSPAKAAGIQPGDVITTVNGTPITHDDQLALLVHGLGQRHETVTLAIERNNRCFARTMTPVYCQETESYRIGLFIRDNAGGVGTLTYADPDTLQYGALGHMISNRENQQKINILQGKLVTADIHGIKKGQKGYPGEKIGRFVSNQSLGTIEKNTFAGIFGVLADKAVIDSPFAARPLPTADPAQITTGPAQILTTIHGNQVEAFSIEILRIFPGSRDGKGLVLRVTDPVLLEETGGIVQGMSGSPILQDGHIIGAVTHVFLNDPTKGYGILIHTMLQQSSHA